MTASVLELCTLEWGNGREQEHAWARPARRRPPHMARTHIEDNNNTASDNRQTHHRARARARAREGYAAVNRGGHKHRHARYTSTHTILSLYVSQCVSTLYVHMGHTKKALPTVHACVQQANMHCIWLPFPQTKLVSDDVASSSFPSSLVGCCWHDVPQQQRRRRRRRRRWLNCAGASLSSPLLLHLEREREENRTFFPLGKCRHSPLLLSRLSFQIRTTQVSSGMGSSKHCFSPELSPYIRCTHYTSVVSNTDRGGISSNLSYGLSLSVAVSYFSGPRRVFVRGREVLRKGGNEILFNTPAVEGEEGSIRLAQARNQHWR